MTPLSSVFTEGDWNLKGHITAKRPVSIAPIPMISHQERNFSLENASASCLGCMEKYVKKLVRWDFVNLKSTVTSKTGKKYIYALSSSWVLLNECLPAVFNSNNSYSTLGMTTKFNIKWFRCSCHLWINSQLTRLCFDESLWMIYRSRHLGADQSIS